MNADRAGVSRRRSALGAGPPPALFRRQDLASLARTFEEIRARAYGEIGDVLDTLRSDWLRGHGPTDAQADALTEARELLAKAKTALNRAAR